MSNAPHSGCIVTPAQAGVQGGAQTLGPLDSRFRGNDEVKSIPISG
jgi:hypothetical protein